MLMRILCIVNTYTLYILTFLFSDYKNLCLTLNSHVIYRHLIIRSIGYGGLKKYRSDYSNVFRKLFVFVY